MRVCVLALLLGCGAFPDPRGDGTVVIAGCCQLDAVVPSTAHTGDVIAIDGRFAPDARVRFPGQTTFAPPLAIGSGRLLVSVPADATIGELTVSTNGQMLTAPFRLASFELGLTSFRRDYAQVDVARQMPRLTAPRDGATSVVVRGSLYMIGGAGQQSIDRARIEADGTLGAFTTVGAALSTARMSASSIVVRDQLYVIGGFSSASSVFDSIEVAPVMTDSSLGAFTVVSTRLLRARADFATALVGGYLYVIGGSDGTTAIASIERAPIAADGTLGAFEDAGSLVTARSGHVAAVLGNSLYVFAGADAAGQELALVERAAINLDGSVGAFEMLASQLTAARARPALAVYGNSVYIIGGRTSGGARSDVDTSVFDTSGELAGFAQARTSNLVTARYGHSVVVIGNYVYAIGGTVTGQPLLTVEHASINANGRVAPFAEYMRNGPTVSTAPTVVIGNYVYAVGGFGVTATVAIQRAPIEPDGTLGDFDLYPTMLLVPRSNHALAVAGDYLYALGGSDTNGALGTIERARISDEGSIDDFILIGQYFPPRADHAVVILDNKLFVIGGRNSTAHLSDVSVMTIGDTTPGMLPSSASVTARSSHVALVAGDFVWALHGDGPSGTAVMQYASFNRGNSTLGSFGNSTIPVSYSRVGAAATLAGAQLWLFGGVVNANTTASADYNIVAPTGTIALGGVNGVQEIACDHSRAVALGNYVYLIGNKGAGTVRMQQAALQ